jgi:trafficking protein particle complex subunit 3
MASKGQTNTMNASQVATALWQKQAKCNAEFFALTYGALVAELLRDLEDAAQITAELDRMGHSIGVRCIEEVLAKTNASTKSFAETAELMQTAFRMFLGLSMDAKVISETSYLLSFPDNPLAIFVELPPPASENKLEYSQLLAGMVRGMLEMLQYDVSSRIASSVLAGGETNEIAVELKQILQEGAGEDYQEE